MKTYIVYDSTGNEVCYWRGASHNAAEAAAKEVYGSRATVSYTELGKEFDHIKGGFFFDHDAKKPEPLKKVVNKTQPLLVAMPTEDWHVICGWLESVERDHGHMPTAAKELATKLRVEHFPV